MMDPKDNANPEEKLLRLIRQPAHKGTNKKQAQENTSASKKKTATAVIEPAALKKPDKKKHTMVFSGISAFNFTAINRYILFFLFVVVSLFIAELCFNNQARRAPAVLPHTTAEFPLKEKQVPPFSYYKNIIAQRELFKSYFDEKSTKQTLPAGPTFRDLIKNLNLLGIVSGEKLQVIIEDRQLNKTYFLYQGDYLGEIKIEEIHPDKVILGYKGEQVNLFM